LPFPFIEGSSAGLIRHMSELERAAREQVQSKPEHKLRGSFLTLLETWF
jgi:hypothetical protein